jgi:hypothetical protein
VHDEDGALLGRETLEAALELVTVGGRPGGIGLVRRSVWSQPDFDDAVPPVSTCLAVASPYHETMEPAIEAVRIADCADMEPGRNQGLLYRVGGKVVVAEDEAGRPMEAVERLIGERREGVVLAIPRPENEISLHGSTG